jgi:hypothetical protein
MLFRAVLFSTKNLQNIKLETRPVPARLKGLNFDSIGYNKGSETFEQVQFIWPGPPKRYLDNVFFTVSPHGVQVW